MATLSPGSRIDKDFDESHNNSKVLALTAVTNYVVARWEPLAVEQRFFYCSLETEHVEE